MLAKLVHTISTLLFLVILLKSPSQGVADSPPECPYPCLPPPTSATNYAPPPPASPSEPIYPYPPPPPGTPDFGNYPPPPGYVPYLSPPYVNYPAPPPPNPIVPWFPFYSRPSPSQSSASLAIACVGTTLLTMFLGFLLYY